MTDRIKENVFYTLFSDVEDIEKHLEVIRRTSAEVAQECEVTAAADLAKNLESNVQDEDLERNLAESSRDPALKRKLVVNDLVEELFAITLNEKSHSLRTGRVTELIYLKELALSLSPENIIDKDILKQALFERLILEDPSSLVIRYNNDSPRSVSSSTIENECISFLFHSYTRVREKISNCDGDDIKSDLLFMMDLIYDNAATALREPALYEECHSQNLAKQVVNLFSCDVTCEPHVLPFLSGVSKAVEAEEPEGSLFRAFQPVLDRVREDLEAASITNYPQSHLELLKTFASIPALAKVLLEHSTATGSVGALLAKSALGAALNLSCLPKSDRDLYEYFDYADNQIFLSMETNIWTGMSSLAAQLHKVFVALLHSEERHTALQWLGTCLDLNVQRGRLSAMNAHAHAHLITVSNGFALNLTAVLLRLAEPFTDSTDAAHQQRLLRIDPTYTSYSFTDGVTAFPRGVHMKTMAGETCLLPADAGNRLIIDEDVRAEARERGESRVQRPLASGNFKVITEFFFMCHRSLDIGLRVVLEEMEFVYKQLVKLKKTLAMATAQGHQESVELLKESFEVQMKRYFCLRCALFEPSTLQLLIGFIGATADWVVQVLLDDTSSAVRETFAPLTRRQLTFPLPDHIPATLKCIPEMLVEHTACYLVLTKRFAPQNVLMMPAPSEAATNHVLSMLLALMSSNKRARNPHLRARMAECLECLLPLPDQESKPLIRQYRHLTFVNHPHADQVVRCLLDVFVGIEMTGESVSFEQKFNYRQPMYSVMHYLWEIPKHRACFKNLAREAEDHMDAVTPPLFLRFLNLLMNDAIFLLDEALTNMAKLRTLIAAREGGEWNDLPEAERERNEMFLQQSGAAARIDNILGGETIRVLEYLSSEIKSIFCHRTMSDRVAAMLNYFLNHLVGPRMKNFKVKNSQDYKFDPATIVKNICHIYVHLSSSDEFCKAVSRDGRSYNPTLFQLARNVLRRIGGSSLIGDLLVVEEKVQKLAAEQEAEEEILAEIPDEFLDPIMSTLMLDPVTLPSSRMNIDRSTISRHILSDQSDPFNRSLLTMNMVIPNTELKSRIEQWKAERMRTIMQRKTEEAAAAAAAVASTSSEGIEEEVEREETQEEGAEEVTMDDSVTFDN